MSPKTVCIVSSGSCLVREFWRVAAACGQTNANWALTVHPIEKRIRHYLPPYPLECTGRAMLAANKRCVKET